MTTSNGGAPNRRVLLQNVATALVVLALGVYLLARPLTRYLTGRGSRTGAHAATPADSVTDLAGGRHPLLAGDSATMLVLVDATCLECRMSARTYVDLARWVAIQGAATRLVLRNDPAAAAQYARLAGAPLAMTVTDAALHDRFGRPDAPLFLLVDTSGVIRGRWAGRVPTHLAVLNVAGTLTGSVIARAGESTGSAGGDGRRPGNGSEP